MTEQQLIRQRLYRKRTGNIVTRRYEKTPKGYIMRMYRNMKSRVTGVQKKKAHLYKNLYLLPKEDFYNWITNNPKFLELYNEYKAKNYSRKLAPSVDRVNSAIGYEIHNMEIVTHGENSRRGSINRQRLRICPQN